MKKDNCSWILTDVNYMTPLWGINWYYHRRVTAEICCNNFRYIYTVFHEKGSLYNDIEKVLPLAILLS